MLQIAAVASAEWCEGVERVEPVMLRQRAFAALRELLTRVAASQPLMVCIDDLQWADADSIVLLEELVRPPQAPPMLTIACFRTEEIASKPCLQALLERAGSKTTLAVARATDRQRGPDAPELGRARTHPASTKRHSWKSRTKRRAIRFSSVS